MKNMKKKFLSTAALVCFLFAATSCGKEQLLLYAKDYELNMENGKTSKGIAVGDTAEAFLAAYSNYEILTSVDGDSYKLFPPDEIPFSDAIETILPTYYIDGIPVTIDQLCEENEVEKTSLLPFLTSKEYLEEHTVVYYYLVFSWKDGTITDIQSKFMDYNEDASYYEELH